MLSCRQSGPRAIRCEGGVVTQVYTHVVSPSPPSACPEESGGVIVTPLKPTSIWGSLSSKANTQTTVAHPSWNPPCSFCSAEAIRSPFRSPEMGRKCSWGSIPPVAPLTRTRVLSWRWTLSTATDSRHSGTVLASESCTPATVEWGNVPSLCLGSGSITPREGARKHEFSRVAMKARAAMIAFSFGFFSCK